VPADVRDVLAELLPVELDETVPVAVFSRPHLTEHLGRRGERFFQSVFEVAVDLGVFFFQGDGEGEDFAFGQRLEGTHWRHPNRRQGRLSREAAREWSIGYNRCLHSSERREREALPLSDSENILPTEPDRELPNSEQTTQFDRPPEPFCPPRKPPEQIGPYRLEGPLGHGGMGEVFLAWDELLERRVAIKRIRQGAPQTPDQRERFRREARSAARLSHSAIVQIHELIPDL